MTIASTIVVCAHNEEQYIHGCLTSILAQTLTPTLIILVLDRCNDRTEEIGNRLLSNSNAIIIRKNKCEWNNSIAESLEIARERAKGDSFVIVDADIVVPHNFLERLAPQLQNYASVSALAITDPSRGFLNRLVHVWEKTYRFAPLGEQPRGGCRAVSMTALAEIHGFHDVRAWDSDLDTRLRRSGYRAKLEREITVLHRRKMTTRGSISYQINAGRARRELGVGIARTILHSFFRVRPFVLYGYLRSRAEKVGC